jgi:hypothetical protein
MKRATFGLLLSLALLQPAGADTYVSPSGSHQPPFSDWFKAATNIQAAVDAAMPSGTVWVADGRYVSQDTIWLNTKPVSIRSMNGPAVTMLDGGYPAVSNPVFSINHAGVEISGFMITGGGRGGLWFFSAGGSVSNCLIVSNRAAAVWYDEHSAGGGRGGGFNGGPGLVTDCLISRNSAEFGAGALLASSGMVVSNCVIRENWCTGDYVGDSGNVLLFGGARLLDSIVMHNTNTGETGGGVMLQEGGEVARCLIASNWVGQQGGGVVLNWCVNAGKVTDSIIEGNYALMRGGGVHTYVGGLVSNCIIRDNGVGATNYTSAKGGGAFLNWGGLLVDCLITNNTAPYYGGGVEIHRTGTVLRCEVTGNRSAVAGSGIHTTQGGVVRENRILHNQTSLRGTGLCCDEGYAIVENNLIAGQHADSWGGGLYASDDCMVRNNTIVHNSALIKGAGVVVGNPATFINNIVYYNTVGGVESNIWHAAAGTWAHTCTTPAYGAACVTNPPLFADTAAADFRLMPGSPCIDSGAVGPASDLAGRFRPLDGNNDTIPFWDIGAYEYLHPSADSDADSLPDAWEEHCLGHAVAGQPSDDLDEDGQNNLAEFTADTDPRDAASLLRIAAVSNKPPSVQVLFSSSNERYYTLAASSNLLAPGGGWLNVPSQTRLRGAGGMMTLSESNHAPVRLYRVEALLP